MPRVAIGDWVEEGEYVHPAIGARLAPYAHRVIGDAAGLTQFGAHLERLYPGARSSLRHWHSDEDEMVLVLEGEVVLIEDVETVLRAGDAAAWRAGDPVGHCLENRSDRPAVYLTVGTRAARDVVSYPDDDLVTRKDGARRRDERADGTLIGER
ncbi:cupin domain-containing protein [Amaricoccus sp.]|uniref:cupin domain-containing protein n=1 Tax=Amaricoccus sp. TaxID=1872485 RepID=UPI001B5D341D|nr:cupin domain-containing protein [Amaricoccus sp.]MBP7002033.1 cupin domain-containing protein [Amaricoccus sp.]